MMSITVGEILGRYILTGVILWGVLFIMLALRMCFVAKRFGGIDTFKTMESILNSMPDTKSIFKKSIGFILWPYGTIGVCIAYMKFEKLTIEKLEKNN